MSATIARALWSHWRRSPLQLFTLLAGLILATALWSGVQAVNAEARASYDAAAATLGEGQFDQIIPRQGDDITQASYIALRRAGWQVAPVIEGRWNGFRLIGLDPLTAPATLSSVQPEEGFDFADYLRDGPLSVSADTAEKLRDLTERPLRIVADLALDTVVADIGVAQTLLRAEGKLTRLIVAPTQPMGLPTLAVVAPELRLEPAQADADVGRLTDSFHLNLTAFGLLSFAVGIFIVHGAIGLAFEQRRAMIRTLRAMGVPLAVLVILMATELLVFALIGGGIGVLCGYAIAALLLPDVAATLEGLYGAQVAGTLQFRASWWMSGLAICIGGTALASSGALWRLSRVSVIETGRAQTWRTLSGKASVIQAVVALALLAITVVLAGVGQGLIAGFALLGCLLLGAALALPLLLSVVLAGFRSFSKQALPQWFWADTRQQLPGLSLALMALLLAMAANVGVSTMVSSFRLTFVGFLDQRLFSELYVRADDADQSAALQRFLTPRSRAVLPIVEERRQIAGLPSELYGAKIGPSYSDNWDFLAAAETPWQDAARGQAVLVNEQLARRAGLWVGDQITLSDQLSLPIAGVFGDYGNPIGQVVISQSLFNTLVPDAVPLNFGVRSDDARALRQALIDDFGLRDSQIVDQDTIKALSLSIFERTFTVTGALNILTLAVAGFAILMSLLTLAAMRVPQLAPVWALGLTRRKLGQLELIRALVLAALTALFALPLGLALAWVLLAIVNVEAFGWRLPMYLFPADYLKLGLFATVAAILAASWPALKLSRLPPADLLKVFSNER
ncbi:MAG: FtsX-like permease family protein [Pseudomonadota bacterium]